MEHVLTAILTATIAALIKVVYDAGKSLNSLLKEHGERIAVLEIEVKEVKQDVQHLEHRI